MSSNKKRPCTIKAKVLLALQFLSDFGDQITTALLAICILDISNSASKVGFVYFISTAGFMIFTLAGGLLGDHLSKTKLVVFSDLGRGLVVLLMILALKEKSLPLIYCTSFFLSILGSLHRPVKLSIWTEAIPEQSLEKYNSLSELSLQASTIVGPLIASAFVLANGKAWGFAIDAMTFFICAIVFFMYFREKKSHDFSYVSKKRDLFAGLKIIWKDRDIFKYVSYDSIQMIGFGAFNAIFLVLAQRDFGWSKAEYSIHLSIVAVFTTLGACLGASSFVRSIEPNKRLFLATVGSAGFLWAMMAMQSFPLSSILVGLCDGLAVMTMAITRTRVQLKAKELYKEHITSIIASRSVLIKAATLLGTGLSLALSEIMPLTTVMTLMILPISLAYLPLWWLNQERAVPTKLASGELE